MKRKIFLTGGRGMVGRNILEHPLSKKFSFLTPTSQELDLRDFNLVQEYLGRHLPDYIIHAAGLVGGIQANIAKPVDYLITNFDIGRNVVLAARNVGIKKLINISSSCMYPRNGLNPLSESLILKGELEPTNEGYALAKITGLRMCEYYRRQYNFNAISCMPANLYGPNDNFIPEHGHVIPGIITKMYNAMINGEKSIECWGDGTPTREFLYVDDLADACFWLMQNYDEKDFVNVGSNEELTIKDLVNKLTKEFGFKGKVVWNKDKPNGTPRRKMDNSKLKDLGWVAQTSFDEGLKRTIDWYKKEKGIL
jgi:GDP-L-fucose synthase